MEIKTIKKPQLGLYQSSTRLLQFLPVITL